MKKYFTSYWIWFFALLLVVTINDIIEHLSRADSYFSQNSVRWLAFSITSYLGLVFIIIGLTFLRQRFTKSNNLILDSISIVGGFMGHMLLTGPLFSQILVPDAGLNFKFNGLILAIALGVFYVVRLVNHFVTTSH